MKSDLTAADRLILLAARDVTVTLSGVGQLIVEGPEIVLAAVTPILKMHKRDIVNELQRQARAMS